MDKTQKERILHALQRLEQNVGKVCYTVVMFPTFTVKARWTMNYAVQKVIVAMILHVVTLITLN